MSHINPYDVVADFGKATLLLECDIFVLSKADTPDFATLSLSTALGLYEEYTYLDGFSEEGGGRVVTIERISEDFRGNPEGYWWE